MHGRREHGGSRRVISGNEHDCGGVNQCDRAKAVRDVNLSRPVERPRRRLMMCCAVVRCLCHSPYLVRNILLPLLSFRLFPTLVFLPRLLLIQPSFDLLAFTHLHGQYLRLCSSCLLRLLFLQCSPQVRHCTSYALRKWSGSAFCPVLFQKAQLLVYFLDCVRIVV